MSEELVVQSHRGPYTVVFDEQALQMLDQAVPARAHFLVDAKVAGLYAAALPQVLVSPSVLLIEATEPNKSLEQFPGYVEHLVARGVRRGHILVAIGGGIIQDITCFLAATLLRGLAWHFYPTTLLAQADSCIGSKSSINCGDAKNLLGTFTPPARIVISTAVLGTLEERDVRSGIGEMLKVHAIAGPQSFDRIAAGYSKLLTDRETLVRYIRGSLEIKRGIIEQDEFDRGPRNVLNYGHSFGHAIEAATDFIIPHGIAVTLGMDFANYVAVRLGRMGREHFDRMHGTLAANARGFEGVVVPLPRFFAALAKDKKNTDTALGVILPDADARLSRCEVGADETFRGACMDFLAGRRL